MWGASKAQKQADEELRSVTAKCNEILNDPASAVFTVKNLKDLHHCLLLDADARAGEYRNACTVVMVMVMVAWS